MGETVEDRIDLALELRKQGVKSIPLNILSPIKGTPLENAAPLSGEDVLRTIAVWRSSTPRPSCGLPEGVCGWPTSSGGRFPRE